jgi:hypothetical protein
MRVIAMMIDIAKSAATTQNHGVLATVGFSSFTIFPFAFSPSWTSRRDCCGLAPIDVTPGELNRTKQSATNPRLRILMASPDP